MNNSIGLLILLLVAMLTNISPSVAHGDKDHTKEAAKAVATPDQTKTGSGHVKVQAIAALEKGIAFMAMTMSDEKNKEMFSNGPVMHEWHGEVVKIEDAIEALHKLVSSMDDKSKQPVDVALEQISDSLDDFHIATHSNDLAKGRAEAKKARSSVDEIIRNLN